MAKNTKIGFECLDPFLEAEDGDFRGVADLIERGDPLPSETRRLVAAYLRDNFQEVRKNILEHKTKRTYGQEKREFEVFLAVQANREKGMSEFRAIQALASELNMSEDTIKTYVRNIKREFSNIINRVK